MTKTELLAAYRADLLERYAWAVNINNLDRMVSSAERTIRTTAATWHHNGISMSAAWRRLGGKGRPTLKAMRALPE